MAHYISTDEKVIIRADGLGWIKLTATQNAAWKACISESFKAHNEWLESSGTNWLVKKHVGNDLHGWKTTVCVNDIHSLTRLVDSLVVVDIKPRLRDAVVVMFREFVEHYPCDDSVKAELLAKLA
ncbi:hypothetical protein D3C71_1394760 [compost metagenome]